MEPSNLSSFISTKFFETDVTKETLKQLHQANKIKKTGKCLDHIKDKISKNVLSPNGSLKNAKSSFVHCNVPFSQKTTNSLQISRNITTSKWSSTTDTTLCAIYEIPNTLLNKVGCCIVNFNTGELIISEMIDTPIFIRILHKIQVYEPTLIITPSSSFSPCCSKLVTILKNNIPEYAKMKDIPTKTFSAEKGFELIKEHTIERKKLSSLYEEIQENKYAVSAVSGALWFIMNNLD